MIDNPLWNKLRTGEVDANGQEIFLSALLKALIYNLNEQVRVRNESIPFYILNTGDDIMYLSVKGQDHSIEPLSVSNENYVYSTIPRCMVEVSGLNILLDQLTSPYTRGEFTFEYDDTLYNFSAEYRRVSVKIGVSLKFLFDNFTDSLEAVQQIITHQAFINKFSFNYLGHVISASYTIPDGYNTEYSIEFDGLSQDDKNRKLNIELDVESNLPIIYSNTIIPSDAYIKGMRYEHILDDDNKHDIVF